MKAVHAFENDWISHQTERAEGIDYGAFSQDFAEYILDSAPTGAVPASCLRNIMRFDQLHSVVSNLAAKTSVGFAGLILLLAIAAFAPAWTLHFWQAWLYLFLFASSSASITT